MPFCQTGACCGTMTCLGFRISTETIASRHTNKDRPTKIGHTIPPAEHTKRIPKQIAGRLHLSPEPVRTHIRAVLRALDVHSRLEAVAVARRDHLAAI